MKRARTFTVEITNREPAPLPHPTARNGLILAPTGKGWKSEKAVNRYRENREKVELRYRKIRPEIFRLRTADFLR